MQMLFYIGWLAFHWVEGLKCAIKAKIVFGFAIRSSAVDSVLKKHTKHDAENVMCGRGSGLPFPAVGLSIHGISLLWL